MSRFIPILMMIALVTAGCSQFEAITSTMTAPMIDATSSASESAAAITPPPDENSTLRPDWHYITLVDARTGETFTFADFEGQTVWVEPMATWCTNCRAQMRQVTEAQRALDDSYVFISISVAENVTNEALAAYADREGFNWLFAITPPEMLQALTNEFGRAVVTPPSTPHFIINPNGLTSRLATGSHNAGEIITLLRRASSL